MQPRRYIVWCVLVLAFLIVVSLPQSVGAAEPYDYSKSTAMQTPCSFTSGSGILSPEGVVFRESCTPALLANFIATLVKFLLRLTIALAVLMVVIGGFQWLMAMGNSGKISNAKETVQQALIGLILAFVSYLLFLQIDQSFVLLKSLDVAVDDVELDGCAQYFPQKKEYIDTAMRQLGLATSTPAVAAAATELARKDCIANSCMWDEENGLCKGFESCNNYYSSLRRDTGTPTECKSVSNEDKSCIKTVNTLFGWAPVCCSDTLSNNSPTYSYIVWNLPRSEENPCKKFCGKEITTFNEICGWPGN